MKHFFWNLPTKKNFAIIFRVLSTSKIKDRYVYYLDSPILRVAFLRIVPCTLVIIETKAKNNNKSKTPLCIRNHRIANRSVLLRALFFLSLSPFVFLFLTSHQSMSSICIYVGIYFGYIYNKLTCAPKYPHSSFGCSLSCYKNSSIFEPYVTKKNMQKDSSRFILCLIIYMGIEKNRRDNT